MIIFLGHCPKNVMENYINKTKLSTIWKWNNIYCSDFNWISNPFYPDIFIEWQWHLIMVFPWQYHDIFKISPIRLQIYSYRSMPGESGLFLSRRLWLLGFVLVWWWRVTDRWSGGPLVDEMKDSFWTVWSRREGSHSHWEGVGVVSHPL